MPCGPTRSRRGLMPNYCAVGSLGITFERAYSNGTRTSITLPLAQKNYRDGEPLATRLFKAGIKTTAVIADAGLEGTAAIATTYERVVKPDQGRWQGLQATEGALRALDEAGSKDRHFLWIHLYDAHTPYPMESGPRRCPRHLGSTRRTLAMPPGSRMRTLPWRAGGWACSSWPPRENPDHRVG
jgi:hypothetical protein